MIGDGVIINEAGSHFNGYVGTVFEEGTSVSNIIFNDDSLRVLGPLPFNNDSIRLVSRGMRRTKYNEHFVNDQKVFNDSFASYSNYRKTKEEIESGEWFKKNFQLDWRRVGLATILLLCSGLSYHYFGLLCMVGAIACSILTIYFIRPKGVLEYIAANPSKEWKPIEQQQENN